MFDYTGPSDHHAEKRTMNDEQQIKDVIQTYFYSMHESSADKVRAAFHPRGRLFGFIDDELHEMSTADFAGFVAGQQPSPREQGLQPRVEIVSIDIAGSTAAAKVRDDYLGLAFLDFISLVKTDGRWSIYNKLFHVEGAAG